MVRRRAKEISLSGAEESVNGGLVNEYVKVDVTAATITAQLVAFHPDGTPMTDITDTFTF